MHCHEVDITLSTTKRTQFSNLCVLVYTPYVCMCMAVLNNMRLPIDLNFPSLPCHPPSSNLKNIIKLYHRCYCNFVATEKNFGYNCVEMEITLTKIVDVI